MLALVRLSQLEKMYKGEKNDLCSTMILTRMWICNWLCISHIFCIIGCAKVKLYKIRRAVESVWIKVTDEIIKQLRNHRSKTLLGYFRSILSSSFSSLL